jgi:hypothetical protein
MKKRKPVIEVGLKVHVAIGAELLIRCLPAILALIKALVVIVPHLRL